MYYYMHKKSFQHVYRTNLRMGMDKSITLRNKRVYMYSTNTNVIGVYCMYTVFASTLKKFVNID